MAVDTTGSIVTGLVPGLRDALKAPTQVPSVFFVVGTPNAKVTSIAGSDIAIDYTNGKFYMAKNTNGSTWYNLGSVA